MRSNETQKRLNDRQPSYYLGFALLALLAVLLLLIYIFFTYFFSLLSFFLLFLGSVFLYLSLHLPLAFRLPVFEALGANVFICSWFPFLFTLLFTVLSAGFFLVSCLYVRVFVAFY
jgi:hypothetical protein